MRVTHRTYDDGSTTLVARVAPAHLDEVKRFARAMLPGAQMAYQYDGPDVAILTATVKGDVPFDVEEAATLLLIRGLEAEVA